MQEVTIINDDCLNALRKLDEAIIDAAITSPPYNIGKGYDLYDDKNPNYTNWLAEVFGEVARVLKPDGHFFLNVGWTTRAFDLPYKVLAAAEKHFQLQNNIIWVKHIKVGKQTYGQYRPSTSDYFMSNTWEHIFHLTKQPSKIDVKAVAGEYDKSLWNGENEKRKLHEYRARRRLAKKLGYANTQVASGKRDFEEAVQQYLLVTPYVHSQAKDEGCVWFIPYEPVSREFNTKDHPAIYPVELAERCVLLSTQEGDLVLDPFSGSFTTAVACVRTNRRFIGTEMSSEYCRLGKKRIECEQNNPLP